MRKTLTIGMAAMTAAVGMFGATGASAQHYRYYRHHDNDHGDAIAAGVVGLALGAALASGNRDRDYDRGYYGRSYYGGGYYAPRYSYYDAPRYGYGYYNRPYYRSCRTVRVWDPYYGSVYQRRCW